MIFIQLLLFLFSILRFSRANNSIEDLTENDVLLSYRLLGEDPSSLGHVAIVKMYLEIDDYPWAQLVGNEFLERSVHITTARIHSGPNEGAHCVLVDAGDRTSIIFTPDYPIEFPADHIFGDESWSTSYFHCFTAPEKRPDIQFQE